MQAIERLVNEHEVIVEVMGALESYVNTLVESADCTTDDLGAFVEFIRDYADARHHKKEENILFVAMEEHGFSRQAGPLAVMLADHDEGREQTGIMAEVAASDAPWSTADKQKAAGAARAFVSLLRGHILKENNVLYPMAQSQIPADAQQRVSDACVEVDDKGRASGRYDELEALAKRLISTYGNGSP